MRRTMRYTDIPDSFLYWHKKLGLLGLDPSTKALADFYDSLLLSQGIKNSIHLVLHTCICQCRVLICPVIVDSQWRWMLLRKLFL